MSSLASPSFDDTLDFENATRGFVAALEPCVIKNADGRVVWNNDEYDFLQGAQCPETANPKLWRQAQLCSKQGLFMVTDGIYQVRGLDLSHITLVEGDHGVIVIDPLVSIECAKAALELYKAHRGDRPVTGMIYTHSHGDHFGGSRGVLSNEDTSVPIIAPEGFLEHAVSENVYAGTAMTRRAVYMYGDRLPKDPTGQLSAGLGMTVSTGMSTLIPPTVHVTKTGQEEIVDGVRMVFQLTPGTEAPSEMNFYFPQRRALCMAENATHTMHNILTLRGAVVRDARVWSRYLDEAIVLFAQDSEVVFASHHWPTWGHKAIITFLSEQRDLYAYLHDQTLRMINQGLTGSEIAENFVLPSALQKAWHVQGFYGSVSHNVKAIYQRYMGWYDGNPAHLWEHPPEQAAERYVSCMGGVDEVVRKAEDFAKKGDLRFAATLLSHAVFADAENTKAKQTLASVFDRLGRGSENGPWRNFYLTGALELRGGPVKVLSDFGNVGMLRALTVEQLFDSLAVRLDGPRAQDESFTISLRLKDLKQHYQLSLHNGALIHRMIPPGRVLPDQAGFDCELAHAQLLELVGRQKVPDGVEQQGDSTLVDKLFSLLALPNPDFPIVTP